MSKNLNNNQNRFSNNNNMYSGSNIYSNNPYQGPNVYQFNNKGNQYQQTGVGMRNNNYSNSNITPEGNIVRKFNLYFYFDFVKIIYFQINFRF